MFFSVDVETASTNPTPGALLSVGIVAVDDLKIVDQFYVNLAYDDRTFDKNTIEEFWEKQDEYVVNQAFSWKENRVHAVSAAAMIYEFVTKLEPEKDNAIFAANPVSFDFAWVNMLFYAQGLEFPFTHRSLCMRSMRFGITGGDYGKARGKDEGYPTLDPVEPKHKHHALYDAYAQAEDLINMLKFIQR